MPMYHVFIYKCLNLAYLYLLSQNRLVLPDSAGMGPTGWNFGQRQSETAAIMCGRDYTTKISFRFRCLCWISRNTWGSGYVGIMTVTGQYVLGPEFRPKWFWLHVSQTSVGQLHCSLCQNCWLPVCITFLYSNQYV